MALSPRLKAFLIHLGCSALVAGSAALFVSQVWYPSPLLRLLGGFEIFLIVVAVDVMLGPTITLVIANPAKPRKALLLDYAIISTLQVGALIYGLQTLSVARPAFIVFAKDGFLVVRANDVSDAEYAEAKLKAYQAPGLGRPVWALAELPADPAERNRIVMQAVSGGRDYWSYPKYYMPMDWTVAGKAAEPLATLKARLPAGSPLEIEFTSGAAVPNEDSLGFLPFIDRTRAISAIVDRTSGRIVGYAWQSPWK